jgi:hypothetical protein
MKKVLIYSAGVMGAIIVALVIWLAPSVLKAEHAAKFLTDFEKINETKPSLSIAQVEQIMGQPLRIEHAESTGVTGDVYHYPTYPPGGDFQVIFVNGIVLHTAVPVYTSKS